LDELLEAELLSGLGMGVRAELLRVNGRPKDAVDQADAAVEAGAAAAWMAGTKADCLYTLGRSSLALESIEPVVRANPDYLFGQSVRIQALDGVGRVTEALNVLDEHLAHDESWKVWAGSARGSLLIELGRLDDAVKGLEDALEELEGQAWWLLQLGGAYHRLHRVPEAIAALEEGLDTLVEKPAAWVLLELADALTHAAKSSPPEAQALYERVSSGGFDELRPKSGLDVGWASLRLLQVEQSIRAYESTFAATEDMMLGEHLCFAVALGLAGRAGDADAELERTLAAIEALEDRDRARGMLAEGRYVLELLRDDAAWKPKAESLAPIGERLQARIRTE
jgi:tetratricopeptide (TPR) repeat protein